MNGHIFSSFANFKPAVFGESPSVTFGIYGFTLSDCNHTKALQNQHMPSFTENTEVFLSD